MREVRRAHSRPRRVGPNPYGFAHQRERAAWAKVPDKVCGICRYPILDGQRWHLDHVLPVSLGGLVGPKQPAHESCNISKGGANRIRRWR
jgi:hypothetical protein